MTCSAQRIMQYAIFIPTAHIYIAIIYLNDQVKFPFLSICILYLRGILLIAPMIKKKDI